MFKISISFHYKPIDRLFGWLRGFSNLNYKKTDQTWQTKIRLLCHAWRFQILKNHVTMYALSRE